MHTNFRLIVTACLLFMAVAFSSAQTPYYYYGNFGNPSFEGTPQPGNVPAPWIHCHLNNTPDTQPGSWGVTLAPSNGNSYIGLTVMYDTTYHWQEGVSEFLQRPLVAGTEYRFTVDLANSAATGGGIVPGCAECQVWGGASNSFCDQIELLWESGNLTPYDTFQTYTVTFTPDTVVNFISFYIKGLGCPGQPYVLVDNLSPIYSRDSIPLVSGITEMESGEAVELYPNPVSNKLIVVSNDVAQNQTAQIIAVDGRILDSRLITEAKTEIDIDRLPRGVYFLSLQDNKKRTVRRFVKNP